MVPIENGIFGALKIALVVVIARDLTTSGMFVAWVLAMAIMLIPTNSYIFGRVLRTGPAASDPSTALPLSNRRKVIRYVAADYVAALLSQGYNALLPMFVTALLGSTANAYFYVPFLIATTVGALAQALSTSLVVEGAHRESELRAFARRSIFRYVTLVVPGVLVLVTVAPLLLIPFGDAYVANGATVLRLLLLGTLPQAIIALYLGVERVRARVTRVLAVEGVLVVLVTVGVVVSSSAHGLVGLGWAWLAAQTVTAGLVTSALRRSLSKGGR